MTFVVYDVCRLVTFVAYDVCRIMKFHIGFFGGRRVKVNRMWGKLGHVQCACAVSQRFVDFDSA